MAPRPLTTNGPALTIRPLRADDSVEEITHLLHRAYARNAVAGLRFHATYQAPSVTAERLEEGYALIAECDGRIVGTVTVRIPEPQPYGDYAPGYAIAAISQFGVDPELRGAGIGDKLLARSEQIAREAGCREIALDTAQPATELIAHYRSRGFQIVGRADFRPWTNYESWVMTKPLFSPRLEIRGAMPAEFDALAALKARAFRASYLPLIGEAAHAAFLRDATPEWFEARIGDGHTVLVAVEGSRLVGLAVYGPNTLQASAGRELRNVYVEPEITSRGIGRALVDAALDRMRAEGVTAVSLGVFPSNVRAITFYERCGFVRHRLSTWTNQGIVFEDQIMLLTLGD